MPVLEITQIVNHDINIISAAMLFPNDEISRKKHLLINQINHDLKNLDMQNFQISRDDLELLLESPSYESWGKLVAENIKKAIIAGDLCGIIYAMHVFKIPEPSMNKAIHVMKEFANKNGIEYGDGDRLPKSEQTIRNCWNEYRCVAHLWAAFRLNQDYKINDDRRVFTEQGYIPFLEAAAGILGFGMGFVPNRAKRKMPLFDGDGVWKFPDTIKPKIFVGGEFPLLLQNLLENYNAPAGI